MPSGGLMQLVSYGSEDLYLTGNPQITFFKVVYKRHTNFAYEWVPEYFDPTLSFETTSFSQMTLPLKRDGDLIRDVALIIDTPSIFSSDEENFRWISFLGQIWINQINFFIGGQRINHLYGQWINIWSELIVSASRGGGYNDLIGNVSEMTSPLLYYGSFGDTTTPSIQRRRLRVPIPFWFTEHPGLALPLIAIQYVETSIEVEFRPLNSLFTVGNPPVSPTELWENPSTQPGSNHIELLQEFTSQGFGPNTVFWKFVNGSTVPTGLWGQNTFIDVKWVYLDNPERRLFAAAVSEYLITQVERLEFSGLNGENNQEEIEFFHPVKEMIWVFQRDDVDQRNQWVNYTCLPHLRDFPRLEELLTGQSLGRTLGTIPPGPTPGPIGGVMLPSGFTVDEFISFFNCTDLNKLSTKQIDAFDQYFNIMYHGFFLFNGHRRQGDKTSFYYQFQEPFDAHESTPPKGLPIYVFSFADKPEMVQPSGSANFSLFRKAEFNFTLKSRVPVDSCPIVTPERYNLFFYVRNINVLRIMNGLGSLVFGN
jgi:hypothetical protein